MTQKDLAIFRKDLPTNAIPFLLQLVEDIRNQGIDHLKTDSARRILWVINSIAYGYASDEMTSFLFNEYERLRKAWLIESQTTLVFETMEPV